MWKYLLALALALAALFGFMILLGESLERSSFDSRQEEARTEIPWAVGTSDDAIRIIQTIRADPLRHDAQSVHEGENQSSWYFDGGSIYFRGTTFVYASYEDYKRVKKWLKENPAREPAGKAAW